MAFTLTNGVWVGTDGVDLRVDAIADGNGGINANFDSAIDARGGDDIVDALGGNDSISGGNGNDVILGGPGNDLILGGADADLIRGGEDNDTISGGNGHDNLEGDSGNDLITGGTGNDNLFGGEGRDSLYGGDGNDLLDGGSGDDLINGGVGSFDTARFRGFSFEYITRQLSNGSLEIEDSVIGRDGIDILLNIELLWFQDLQLAIISDVLSELSEPAIELSFDRLPITQVPDDLNSSSMIPSFEGVAPIALNLVGTAFGDTLVGGVGSDYLNGDLGDDLLFGDQGDDLLIGGQGNDTLLGGGGSDMIFGFEGDDLIDGGQGNDMLTGGTGADNFFFSPGSDVATDYSFIDGDVITVTRFFEPFALTQSGLDVLISSTSLTGEVSELLIQNATIDKVKILVVDA